MLSLCQSPQVTHGGACTQVTPGGMNEKGKANFKAMELAKNAPSVWPGYVAAVASLVLSLLLLLAILVFAMTQVGNIVSIYIQENLRITLLAERSEPTGASRLAVAVVPSVTQNKPPQPHMQALTPGAPLHQVKLVFGADLGEIPASQMAEVAHAIQHIQAPSDATWLIWSSVLADDALMERATYRLMLVTRKALIGQGIAEAKTDLRLSKSKTPPARYEQGDIVIYFAPLPLTAPEKSKP